MNERIRELAEQTGFTQQDLAHGRDQMLAEFAELIIAECCVALHPMLRDMISRTQAVDMIVDHFRNQ